MRFENPRRVEFGIVESDRGEMRGFFIVEPLGREFRHEMRFDRDQVVDELRGCDLVVEPHGDYIAAFETFHDTAGRAGAGERGENVRTDGGFG